MQKNENYNYCMTYYATNEPRSSRVVERFRRIEQIYEHDSIENHWIQQGWNAHGS